VNETRCSLCKLKFLEALWCPLAGNHKCPVTTQAQPTAEQRQLLKMDEAGERS
jgi:hypothetical protein